MTQKELNKVVLAINSRPRKILHWKSANACFEQERAHLAQN